jgi:membrane protein YdbS with pleckstrin-like domain
MTFANQQVALETLPRFTDVQFHELDPRYARVVLAVALALQTPVLLLLMGLLFAVLVPKAELGPLAGGALCGALLCLSGFLAWFLFRSAQVVRYALRQHDVIVQSGVFWKQETVQPIRRIQHIEQHQGPIDKRFGL